MRGARAGLTMVLVCEKETRNAERTRVRSTGLMVRSVCAHLMRTVTGCPMGCRGGHCAARRLSAGDAMVSRRRVDGVAYLALCVFKLALQVGIVCAKLLYAPGGW